MNLVPVQTSEQPIAIAERDVDGDGDHFSDHQSHEEVESSTTI